MLTSSKMSARRSPLQAELKQRKPFESPAVEAAVAVLRTADMLRRFYATALAPFGLTLAQFNVLRILRGAGADGLPTLEVANRLIERTPGITLMMDRLEKKGWVRRERSTRDRREVRCRLTAAGDVLLTRVDGPIVAADETALAALARRSQKQLIALLDRIRADLTARRTAANSKEDGR